MQGLYLCVFLQIVDRDPVNKRIKVHYKGYGSEDDEWKDCKETRPVMKMQPLPKLCPVSLPDRYTSFTDTLARKIKHSLFITKRKDPEITISMEVDDDVMSEFVGGRPKIHFVTDSGIWPLTSDTPSPPPLNGHTEFSVYLSR